MPGLSVVRKLIGLLHEHDIRYCHWKSTEHIGASMLGLTDLDVMVESGSTTLLEQVLGQAGFKRFMGTPQRSYPGIADYLAMDLETGQIVHLHLHYQLTLGEKHLKGYRLPWEHLILHSRRFNDEHQIYTVDVSIEMLLLLVRSALKIRTRDWVMRCLRGKPYFGGDALREYLWLRERIHPHTVISRTSELLGQKAAESVSAMLDMVPDLNSLVALRRSATAVLDQHRFYSALTARFLRWKREFLWYWSGFQKRYLRVPRPRRRTSANRGLIIAFLGADGSGKSTLCQDINKWLSPKLDVLPAYFGSGDGPKSVLRAGLQAVSRALKRFAGKRSQTNGPTNQGEATSTGKQPNPLRVLFHVMWVLSLARERRQNLKRIWRGRDQGLYVVCDRFPQNQVMGFNDGPLLSLWLTSDNPILARLARWEHELFSWADRNPPDIVIKLVVSPDVALGRKSDMPHMTAADISRRVEAMKGLQFPPSTKVVCINADQPREKVLLQVKQAIWEQI